MVPEGTMESQTDEEEKRESALPAASKALSHSKVASRPGEEQMLNDPKKNDTRTLAHESRDETNNNGASAKAEQNTNTKNVIQGSRADLMETNQGKKSFSEQLYDILEDQDNNDVIAWMPCGTMFQVVNQKKFTMYKMAKLFNIRNLSSFVRKLVRWGFTRVVLRDMRHSDVFHHPHFVKGDRLSVKLRVKCIGRLLGVKAAAGAASNPSHSQPYTTSIADAPSVQTLSHRNVPNSIPWHHHHQSSYRSQPDNGRGRSVGTVPGLDRVSDASAMSAEMLHSSMMTPNADTREFELQNMLRQREMQARELEIQRRRLLMEQKQLQEAAMRMSAQGDMMYRNRPSIWHNGMIGGPRETGASMMSSHLPNGNGHGRWQNQFHPMHQGFDQNGAMGDAFQQGVSGTADAPIRVDETNMSEERSRSRKAAIAALLEEEQQEWEAKQAATNATLARRDQTQAGPFRGHSITSYSHRGLGWPQPPPLSPPKTPSPEQKPSPKTTTPTDLEQKKSLSP